MNIGCLFSDPVYGVAVFKETLSYPQCSSLLESIGGSSCYPTTIGSFTYWQIFSSTSMTIEACLQACATYGFTYAGLCISPTYCNCGNTLTNPTQTSECTMGCSGNNAEFCGDSSGFYYSVYSNGKKIK